MKYVGGYEYMYIHNLLYKIRGEAWNYSCVDCNDPADEWSYIHNTCPNDISNYEPRCYSCHRLYDRGKVRPKAKIPKRLYKRRIKDRQYIIVKGYELQLPEGISI